jgi:uncharacterized peroxidase-related enzyme
MRGHFSTAERAWHAWLDPVGPNTGSRAQISAYADSVWPNSPYFRLLAWHPASLATRTALDRAVFLARPGLGRGERELAATAASRANGCELCASVHARFTATFTQEHTLVERLLTEGADAELPERWRAIVAASVALTRSPSAFGEHHVRALFAAGLSAGDVHDVIQSAAFFAWANRMMLSLGAPAVPDDADAAALGDQAAADRIAGQGHDRG